MENTLPDPEPDAEGKSNRTASPAAARAPIAGMRSPTAKPITPEQLQRSSEDPETCKPVTFELADHVS